LKAASAACERCEAGPEGMSGHDRLSLVPLPKTTPPAPHFVLRCVDCGTEWRRDFGADSGVRWLRTAAWSGDRVDFPRKK
jgi:hypothetical protein